MQVAHKIQLNPNRTQETYFRKACGISRFSWNWALAHWEEEFKKGGKPSGMSLKKEFNRIKGESYPWIFEVTKYAAQQPFLDLQDAWKRFFSKLGGRPNFKKKGKCRDSFYVGGDQIKVSLRKIWIPNLGWVRLHEKLRFQGKINSVVVSRTADRWFAAIQVETQIQFQPSENQEAVGIDLGIHRLATLSNGVTFSAPKPLQRLQRRLKRKQRAYSKKVKGSANAFKHRMEISRLHMHIANIRKDTLHKISTWLISQFREVGIEDLNVKGMMANHCLARAISDLGFYELRRQLEYKAKWRGGTIHLHERFFASSKTCSKCGQKNADLTLSDRLFHCPSCNHKIDRDLNAARNLDPVPEVRREFTPEEMTALLKRVGPVTATSIDETGNQLSAA